MGDGQKSGLLFRPPLMFDRCTDNARKVFAVAKRLAVSKRHNFIRTLHLLFCIAECFCDKDVTRAVQQNVEAVLEAEYPTYPKQKRSSQLPFSPSLERVCEHAAEATDPAEPITPASLLAAILRQRDDPAARILVDLGVDESTVFVSEPGWLAMVAAVVAAVVVIVGSYFCLRLLT